MGAKARSLLLLFVTVLATMVWILIRDWNFTSPPPPFRKMDHFPQGCYSHRDVGVCRPNPFYPFCQKVKVTMDPFYEVGPPGVLHGIALVIVFNNPVYHLIPFLEFLYRRHFDHILFCGDNMTTHWSPFEKTFPSQLDYVQVHFHGGEWGYKCMMEAIKRNYDVQGYIHLSDDVLLNVWNLRGLPRDVPWFYEKVKKARFTDKSVADIWKNKSWWPWTSPKGRGPLGQSWRRLQEMAANGSDSERNLTKAFFANLKAASGSEDLVYYYASDIWYLPASKGKEFLEIMTVFDSYKTYLEIAIPTVLHGLGLPVKLISGTYLWYGERVDFNKSYSPTQVFFHPFKLAQYLYWQTGPPFFCNRFYPYLRDDLHK